MKENYLYLHLPGCNSPLGMESGDIPDFAITASSESSSIHQAKYGRLNGGVSDDGRGWSPTNNTDQWLQVDLGSYHSITKVATQGTRQLSPVAAWVKSYILSYSRNGVRFVEYWDKKNHKVRYCIYSNKRPGRLFHFWTYRMGA